MFLHTSQETQQSLSFACSGKCERCRRVKTTTFVSLPALSVSITSLPSQTTPEIKYFFDKGCKKAIITCPHTPGNTNNFYLLVRTDSPPSPGDQLPLNSAVIIPSFISRHGWTETAWDIFFPKKIAGSPSPPFKEFCARINETLGILPWEPPSRKKATAGSFPWFRKFRWSKR